MLNIAQSLKQPPLFTSFFTLVFPSVLLHMPLPTAVLTVPGAVRMVVISLWFQSSNPLSIKIVKQFGYSFAFDATTVWNALPVHQGIPTLVLLTPWHSLVVLGLFSVTGYWNWLTVLVILSFFSGRSWNCGIMWWVPVSLLKLSSTGLR